MLLKGKAMKTTVLIDGMKCPHCEAHMKEAFEKLDGVVSAAPSHIDKCAVLELSSAVSEEVLKKAVADAGYVFMGIK